MAVRPGLALRGRPALALTPALRQAIALLRLPAADLAEAAARFAADNPFVVLLPPRAPPAAALAQAAAVLPDRPGPIESLRRQIALQARAPAVREAAEYLAGCLDEAGYLDRPLAELAAEAGLPLALAEAGLAALQACEPAGVGARDLAECLRLQLVDRGWEPPAAARLVAALATAGRTGPAGLAAALGLSPPEAARAWAALRALTPRPLDAGPLAEPLRPDLVAEPAPGGGFRVRLARGGMPRLRLDRALAARARAAGFGAEAREAAEAFLAGLRFRGRTLLRIGAALAEAQHRMLAEGEAAQRPLTRAALAAALGLHPATVGRAVAGKAMLAGGRLWPLAAFFSPALPGAEGPISAAAARQMLARLLAAEPPGRPLSDAELARRLAAAGVDIARRTVAKYRAVLRVPAAAGRRRTRAEAAAAPAAPERPWPPPARVRPAAGPKEQEDP